ncbi:MAG: hypothetical protein R3192_00670 [Woeseiaceae bacterium]|nr:hypothetical protein [Woeseiaceae bacterium]
MRNHCSGILLAFTLLLAGCAATPAGNGTIIKALDETGGDAAFRNILVISVAGDFPDRVRFEQAFASRFADADTRATAYYTIVGRRALLNREVLNNVIRVREFDAVILTRQKGQDRPELMPNRPTGHAFDLYRYDYAELNQPTSIKTGSTVSFVVEAYDASASKKVWAIESLLFDTVSVASVIDDQVEAIIAELEKDELVEL